jgi:hypothetical protein
VLVIVLRAYPIDSVSNVDAPLLLRWLPENSGFFQFQGPVFGGEETSLHDVVDSVIRERFHDARVHFALTQAALGSPQLPRRAFSAADLDAELDREARLFCNEPRNFRIDDAARQIVLSSIFQWYESDFTADAARRTGRQHADLLDYIAPYLTPERRAHLRRARPTHRVTFAPFDWRLNDQARALEAEPARRAEEEATTPADAP